MSKRLETSIKSSVIKYAKQKYKMLVFVGGCGNAGIPDCIFFTTRGNVFFIEFKTTSGVCSKIQKYYIELLKSYNFEVFVCSDVASGKNIIDLKSR